jgi:hypothetical protein
LAPAEIAAGAVQRRLETCMEVAAVIGDRRAVARLHAGIVGKLLLAHIAPSPHLGGIEPKLARDTVRQPFEHEAGRWSPGAADRRIGDEVGEDDVEANVHGLQGIRTGKRAERRDRRHQAVRHVAAIVVHALAAHAEHPPLPVGGNLQVPGLVALLRRRHEVLTPVFDPFHRPAQCDRRERDGNLFRIERAFRSKAAAHVRRDHAHAPLVAPEMLRNQTADQMRHLGRAPDRQGIRKRLDSGDDAAAFHRMAAAAMRLEALAKDVSRLPEHLVDRPEPSVEAGDEVVACARMRARRVRVEGPAPIHDGRERLVVDTDQHGGIFGDRAAFGDHHGDGHADMTDLVDRERVVVERLFHQADRRHVRHHLLPGIAEIAGGEHGNHAGNRARRAHVDGLNARMRLRRAHEGGVQDAGWLEIGNVAAAPADELGVFETADLRAEIANPQRTSPQFFPGNDAEGEASA